jgi:hypothetical protein
MKKRPVELTFLALFLFAVALSIPTQVMALTGHAPWELMSIAAKMTPLNIMIFLSAPLVGVAVWRAHPVARYMVPIFGMLVVYNNWFVSQLGGNYNGEWVKVGTGFFLMGLSVILSRDVRDILKHPEKRWWVTPRRKQIDLPIRVCVFQKRGEDTISSVEFSAKTYDLSNGGVYVNMSPEVTGGLSESSLKKLTNGTQCFVSITLKDLTFLQCRAEIVRQSLGLAEGQSALASSYPMGIGLKFLGLSWQEQKLLKEYLAKNHFTEPKRLRRRGRVQSQARAA